MENNEENKKELEQKEKIEKDELKSTETEKNIEETKKKDTKLESKELEEKEDAKPKKKETTEKKDTKVKNEEQKNEKVDEIQNPEDKKEKADAIKKEVANLKKNSEVKSDNKKSDKKKINKKSDNKNMKPVIAIVIAIIVVVIGYLIALNIAKYNAIKEVKTIFDAMKAGDEQTIKNYLDENEENEENQEDAETSKEMTRIMLSNMDYKIISVKPNLNKCTIKLNISNKNLEKIFTNYMQKVFSLVFLEEFTEATEEQVNTKMKDIFEEQYNSEDIETVSNEVTITMKKENGKWNMEAGNKEVINAILPGYESIINSLN